jgi:acyl-CoA thioesterase-2
VSEPPREPNAPLRQLIELLDLEELDVNLYRGQNEAVSWGRLFGGQVAAQALVAAARTVEGRPVHSLHAYFLRPGDPEVPVIYTVDPIRDGSSFTTRRTVALQRGRAIFNMSASFHKFEEGFEHQDEMPDSPDPDSLPTWQERYESLGTKIPEEMRSWMTRERAIDLRSTQPMSMAGGPPVDGPNLVWFRTNGSLPEDPQLHQCLITYASDMSLLDNAVRRHGRGWPGRNVMTASLDHALWFHRAARADEWLLYAQDSPAASGARGFARGTIFSRDGVLVASVAQEGLMRPIKPARTGS